MKTVTQDLLDLFAAVGGADELVSADLYTLTLADGTVIRCSGADQAVTWGGNYFDRTYKFSRGSIREERGVKVSSLDVEVLANTSDLINGVPLIPYARNGGFDGASMKLERVFGLVFGTWVGSVVRFSGRVGPIKEITRDGFSFAVNSWAELLNANMPPNVVQPECMHTLFDTGCGLNRASFANAKTVQSSPAPTTRAFQITNTSPVRAADYFALGRAVFTSGPNAGVTRTIKSFTSGGLVTLIVPLPAQPGVGDAVTLYPGCDKLMATCSGKFSNLGRRKSADFVPVPETAL